MRTIGVTGSASGIGAATRARLLGEGHRVIGVDLREADVVTDLSTARGRREAIARVESLCGGRLDGLVTCAGLMGLPGRPGRILAELNDYGTIELLTAARPWLARGRSPAAVAPGKTETAMLAEGRADEKYGPLIDAFPVPVGRSGRPEEIAALIGFLLSPDARFFCGSVVFCDGGTDAQLRPNDHPSPFPVRR